MPAEILAKVPIGSVKHNHVTNRGVARIEVGSHAAHDVHVRSIDRAIVPFVIGAEGTLAGAPCLIAERIVRRGGVGAVVVDELARRVVARNEQQAAVPLAIAHFDLEPRGKRRPVSKGFVVPFDKNEPNARALDERLQESAIAIAQDLVIARPALPGARGGAFADRNEKLGIVPRPAAIDEAHMAVEKRAVRLLLGL